MNRALWRRIGTAALAAGLVILFALRLFDAAERNTLTVDEPHYVGKGLYLWDSGDYHYVRSLGFHPPLAYHLASLPWLFSDLGEREITSRIGADLLRGDDPPLRKVRELSRLPFILVSCWGALLLFFWAREVAGPAAGLFALSLYTLSPTLLAYSFLAHNDLLVTVFFIQTLYTFWRWTLRPNSIRFVLSALSLGLALLSKLSALLLLPALGLLLLALHYGLLPGEARDDSRRGEEQPENMLLPGLRAGAELLGLILVSLVVVWLGYGFSFAINEGVAGALEGVRLPAFLHALLFDVAANDQGRGIYLLGEISQTGKFWYFLPFAWLIKTPIPILLLLGYATCLARPENVRRGAAAHAIVPIGVFVVVVVFWLRVPLGIRYVLPIFPLIFFFVATRISLSRGGRWLAVTPGLLWLLVEGALIHPHYLAYFNELMGGPEQAHHYLVESNLDWGQDLGSLAIELDNRGNPPIWLAYFGPEDPADHGIASRPLRGCEPVSGTVAISASVLRGLYSPENAFLRPPAGCYDWLLEREPVASPGYSILLYEIERGVPPSSAPLH